MKWTYSNVHFCHCILVIIVNTPTVQDAYSSLHNDLVKLVGLVGIKLSYTVYIYLVSLLSTGTRQAGSRPICRHCRLDS